MAISATFELRDGDGAAAIVKGAFLKTYTVVDLDYTFKRSFDKTGRPSSGASMDFLKVTIRGTKEATAAFHEWINGDDKKMGGVIKIYDSTGYISAISQDFTGGDKDTMDYVGMLTDLATDEVVGTTEMAMEQASDYDSSKEGDIYDEMSKADLINYISEKKLDIKVDKDDTEEILRRKIRYYNKLERLSLEELKYQAKDGNKLSESDRTAIDSDMKLTEEGKIEAYKKKLREWNNDRTDSQLKSTSNKPVYEAADKGKKTVTNAITNLGNKAAKEILEAARAIVFKDAYCVSLREHFHNDPDNKGTYNASYPWILEIGIKPGTVDVKGWNVGGHAQDFGTVSFKLIS